jgi:hypothetical protein
MSTRSSTEGKKLLTADHRPPTAVLLDAATDQGGRTAAYEQRRD